MRDKHSRTGLSKTEMGRKNGAGAGNWGSFNDEEKDEYQGRLDAETEGNDDEPDTTERVHDPTEADIDERNPINELDSRGVAQPIPGAGRRMSHASEEERAEALKYREGGLKQNGVDLASIARTSYGVAQSPPSNGFSTSPLRQKAGFSQVSSGYERTRAQRVSARLSLELCCPLSCWITLTLQQ